MFRKNEQPFRFCYDFDPASSIDQMFQSPPRSPPPLLVRTAGHIRPMPTRRPPGRSTLRSTAWLPMYQHFLPTGSHLSRKCKVATFFCVAFCVLACCEIPEIFVYCDVYTKDSRSPRRAVINILLFQLMENVDFIDRYYSARRKRKMTYFYVLPDGAVSSSVSNRIPMLRACSFVAGRSRSVRHHDRRTFRRERR